MTIDAVAEGIRSGSVRALARGLTWAEEGSERGRELCERLYPLTGRAHVIGITGVPGSGKSTLTRAVARAALARGLRVGVVAVDPSSPYSGGSILGDRIRMNDLAGDSGIFIRSMATRGELGGLSRAAADSVNLMDAAGKDLVIVETVGVGQDEVAAIEIAETIVVVSVPGLGDDIQALKAGILEIADIHVVNKMDQPGADRTIADLTAMLHVHPAADGHWMPPVLGCSALADEGVEPILDALLQHKAVLSASGELVRRRARMVKAQVLKIAEDLARGLMARQQSGTDALFERVASRALTPRACALAMLAGASGNHETERIAAMRRQWEAGELKQFLERRREGRKEYRSGSGLPVKRVYSPEDIAGMPFDEIGFPGQYPFLRGPYPTMYRGRNWTMRQIAGFGTGADTNGRFRYLIEQGQTGLSVDFDMPTLMGYDSDHPRSAGEVGREGVAVDTLDDMEALFDGIDLENISVSMTINPTAWILVAMYVALAESRGNDLKKLAGTAQADILKEYIAQKEWIFPIRPSMRLVRDMIVYCAGRMPRYNPVNISGYHISEAGATAVEELAFTIANGIAYVEEVMRAGVAVDSFAPRLAFYFVSQNDFFEEIAKFRAARRVWAKVMKTRFGAHNPDSMRLRFHCQTAAATLTKAQPMNNIVRTTLEALSAVLGGAQSLHTNGLDEAYAIPSEMAMKVALRTQQIIAEETHVTSVIDPLGGSYYVEALTNQIEAQVFEILQKVDAMGGSIQAIEQGYFQRRIEDSAYDFARRKSSGEQVVIGVNKFVEPKQDLPVEIHRIASDVEARQIGLLSAVRSRRDGQRVESLLDQLECQARDAGVNLMPVTIDLVKARASMGEIVSRLRRVFGSHSEAPVF